MELDRQRIVYADAIHQETGGKKLIILKAKAEMYLRRKGFTHICMPCRCVAVRRTHTHTNSKNVWISIDTHTHSPMQGESEDGTRGKNAPHRKQYRKMGKKKCIPTWKMYYTLYTHTAYGRPFAWMWMIRIRSRHLKNSRKSRFDMQKWIIMSTLVWVRYIEIHCMQSSKAHSRNTHTAATIFPCAMRHLLIFLSHTMHIRPHHTTFCVSLCVRVCVYYTNVSL